MADKIIKGSVEIQNNLTVNGKLNPNSNGYGINLPDTSTLTGDITVATADNIVTYTFSEGSVDKAFTVKPNNGAVQTVNIHGLGDASLKGVSNTVAAGDANLVTSGAVYTAIDNLPEPMVYKGTLGTGGTITTLPAASPANEGFTYKVITAGTYASQEAKVGDVFISNGSAWTLVPAGDDVDDTWRNIKVNNTELLGTGISTGAVNFKDGVNTEISGEGNDISITAIPAIEITWAELKALRDNNKLIPGQSYRITDYITTTVQKNTQSAEHVFDVIVEAVSDNALSEVAQACLHDGDTYFTNSNLSAWKLWYSLDNNASRFAWPLVPTEEHLLYNDMSFLRESQYDGVKGNYCWRSTVYDGEYIFTDTLDAPTTGSYWWFDGSAWSELGDSESVTYVPATFAEGKGVIYRMIDEFDNDLPYDFKNILFTRSEKYTNAYTFSYTEDGSIKDASLLGLTKSCYNNIMKEYIESGKQQLTFNIFYSTTQNSNCYSNIFSSGCYNNTFGSGCNGNVFGNSCHDNTLGSSCTSSTFARYCESNTLGSFCSGNVFDRGCSNNTLGSFCYSNIFGSGCRYNTFGDSCNYNTFVRDCQYNSFRDSCYYNTFASYCQYNTFGESCYHNTFGNSCSHIRFGDSSAVINYCQYNVFDSNCSYINFNSSDTTASASNQLQNVHVHLGVKGASNLNKLTISVYDRNLPFEVEFYLDDSGKLTMSNFASNITWQALKSLRDGGNLVPGRKYRITDYTTTTVQEGTQSAGHVFDVIVEAVAGNALSEEAKACLHAGDTYFANSKLTAWKLWYSLDNDTSRFAWADATNGKGVIYRLIDEFNNDVPYDFKNIQFTTSGKYTNAYTFSYTEDSTIKDASLSGLTKSCYGNVMRESISSFKQELNFNVFYSATSTFNCYSNTFGSDCSRNTFDSECFSNSFGSNCTSNTLGDTCYFNTFGDGCYFNTFGSGCYNNTFGNNCYSNIFGNACNNNTFGNNCASNSFGAECESNTFGNYCASNSFGAECYANTFSNNCHHNTFVDACYRNIFGNYCASNTLGAYCASNIFGNNCASNTFGEDCNDNTFGNNFHHNTSGNACNANTIGSAVHHNTLGSFVRYSEIEDGCVYLKLDATGGSATAFIQYVKVCRSLQGASTSNLLSITPVRNVTYEQEFVNANKVITQINV